MKTIRRLPEKHMTHWLAACLTMNACSAARPVERDNGLKRGCAECWPVKELITGRYCRQVDIQQINEARLASLQGVPKTDPLICLCNNFGKCTPILILFLLLQQENYGAQNWSYFSYLTFIMLPLYLAKQTLMLYQCHYYVIIVFVYNVLHFNAFNHLHRLLWAE